MKMRFLNRRFARRHPSVGGPSVVQPFGMKIASRMSGDRDHRMSSVDIKLTVNRSLDRVIDGWWIGD
jgi:hypothetical protein